MTDQRLLKKVLTYCGIGIITVILVYLQTGLNQ